jgi:hypothetical protein
MENEFIDKDQLFEREKEQVRKEKKSKPKRAASTFTQILNGDILTKDFVLNNLNFIFFIILLLLLIVAKGYYGKQLTKDVNDAQKKLDETTADYVESKARLEERTRRSELVEKLNKRGLKETVNPTKVIRIKSKK